MLLVWSGHRAPPSVARADCSPGRDHRPCRAGSGAAGPRRCRGPGGPGCSSACAASRWLPASPSADPGPRPAAAGPRPPGTGAARTRRLWGRRRWGSGQGSRGPRGESRFPHSLGGAGQVAPVRAAPTVPEGVPSRVGRTKAERRGGLGPGSPESLALPGVGGAAALHAHGLAACARLAVPQAHVGRALGAVA